jgi:hypothetical protein
MPQWLDLKAASRRTSLSIKTLRKGFQDASHPLRAHRVNGKILIAETDLDSWVQSFSAPGDHVAQVVDEVWQGLRARQGGRQRHGRPTLRARTWGTAPTSRGSAKRG